ncbi:MAG: hypothetical protein AAFU41_17110 [Pseudomonadota bacterium]
MAVMRHAPPIAMGLVMGPMMLWMLHGILMGDGGSALALTMFVAAHLGVAVVVLVAAFLAARFAPGLRDRLTVWHRPSLRHFGIMLGAAGGAALLIHFAIHGLT